MFYYDVMDVNNNVRRIRADQWEMRGQNLETSLIVFTKAGLGVIAFVPVNVISIEFIGTLEDISV